MGAYAADIPHNLTGVILSTPVRVLALTALYRQIQNNLHCHLAVTAPNLPYHLLDVKICYIGTEYYEYLSTHWAMAIDQAIDHGTAL